MIFKKFTGILVSIVIAFSLYYCKPVEIILHGDITGLVTDDSTSEPIGEANLSLYQSNKDQSIIFLTSTSTGSDGTYLFRSLAPGEYLIWANKDYYYSDQKNVTVVSAETQKIDFPLKGYPGTELSVHLLDFGFDSTSLSFTIKNIGNDKFTYVLTPSQDWITVYPSSGDLINETDTIIVTINKTGLSESIYKETIEVTFYYHGNFWWYDIINVYLNGLMGGTGGSYYYYGDLNYYKVVRIGTQTWMAENLNEGSRIQSAINQTNNGFIEKYCYNNDESNCKIYGGLYQWQEIMQYTSPDAGIIGTNQGICPVGWHIPTESEWLTLIDYLGGEAVAGGKMKKAGTTVWLNPNNGATNESGFSALPGGYRASDGSDTFYNFGLQGYWWSSTQSQDSFVNYYNWNLSYDSPNVNKYENDRNSGFSVRCVKNPGKQ